MERPKFSSQNFKEVKEKASLLMKKAVSFEKNNESVKDAVATLSFIQVCINMLPYGMEHFKKETSYNLFLNLFDMYLENVSLLLEHVQRN